MLKLIDAGNPRWHNERNSICQVVSAMSTADCDWHSNMMDDEGNYRNESAHSLPGTVSRGSAPQRLNMRHGFIKHIVSLAQSHFTASLYVRLPCLTVHSACRSKIKMLGSSTRRKIRPAAYSNATWRSHNRKLGFEAIAMASRDHRSGSEAIDR